MAPPFVTDHTLVITKREAIPLQVSGTLILDPGWGTAYWERYNPTNRSLAAYAPTLSSFNSTYWKTKAIANLDPWHPKVDLPLFIWELQDLPRMLRDAGMILRRQWKRLIRSNDPGSVYLAYKFGWESLVRDLWSMIDFTKSVEDRKAYFRKLESGSHFRRSLFSGDTNDTMIENGYSLSQAHYNGLLNANVYSARDHQVTTEKIWFTVNAKLKDPLPTGVPVARLALDAVYGMNLNAPSRLWDFVPWTWLIDYFVNVGDYLAAWDTMTRLEITRMNLMATRVKRSTLEPKFVDSHLTASFSELRTTEKRRVVYANPTPGLSFTPFLGSGQVAILGALATTRSVRAIRRS